MLSLNFPNKKFDISVFVLSNCIKRFITKICSCDLENRFLGTCVPILLKNDCSNKDNFVVNEDMFRKPPTKYHST